MNSPSTLPRFVRGSRLLLLSLLLTENARTEDIASPRTRLAYLYESNLYSINEESLNENPDLNQLHVYDLWDTKLPTKIDYRFSFSIDDHAFRWRVSHGMVWACFAGVDWGMWTKRIPLNELSWYDRSDPDREAKFERRFPYEFGAPEEHQLRHKPANRLWERLQFEEGKAFGDFHPLGPKAGLLFLLFKEQMEVFRGTFVYERDPKMKADEPTLWESRYPKQPEEVIDCSLDESFTVFVHSKSYFFLTLSSKLYIATHNPKGNRKAIPFWDKADQPIDRIICDTNSNRSFAFTKPIKKKDGTLAKPVYFELTEKLEPKEFDPSKLRTNKLESPMKEIREAVELLLDLGEIKLPKAKK
jgi:hypothetical protein